jgi:mannose-1-phosphate guanylyltransferase
MAPHPWIVVLAGGEGTRLGPLTRALYGTELPKQFAVLAGDRSLLQQTVERAAMLAPLDRVVVAVSAHHEARARDQLHPYRGVHLAVQPRNLDTGPGLLMPLARIRAADRAARVAFLPSDHHVSDPAPLIEALRASGGAATRDRVTLLGVVPDSAETEYGWILRGRRLSRRRDAFSVRRFEEKPADHVAEHLRGRGALWNTFISVGPVSAFWALARRHLPLHASALGRYARRIGRHDESRALERAYAEMPAANFSRDLLARARDLAVVPVGGTGWCDWGSPRRVFQSLEGTPHLEPLIRRLRSTDLAAFAGAPWARSDAPSG